MKNTVLIDSRVERHPGAVLFNGVEQPYDCSALIQSTGYGLELTFREDTSQTKNSIMSTPGGGGN